MVVRLHISALAFSAICVGVFSYLRWCFQISGWTMSDICVIYTEFILLKKEKRVNRKLKDNIWFSMNIFLYICSDI
ncbi:hypothetical protein CIL02_04260 [Prevotella sp. P3-122]|nr:hypothetical protein CIL02_04260 [Prevotella sp. P3-122]